MVLGCINLSLKIFVKMCVEFNYCCMIGGNNFDNGLEKRTIYKLKLKKKVYLCFEVENSAKFAFKDIMINSKNFKSKNS